MKNINRKNPSFLSSPPHSTSSFLYSERVVIKIDTNVRMRRRGMEKENKYKSNI